MPPAIRQNSPNKSMKDLFPGSPGNFMSAIPRACSRAATWPMKITRSNSTSANTRPLLGNVLHAICAGRPGAPDIAGHRRHSRSSRPALYLLQADRLNASEARGARSDFFDGIDTSLVGLAARLGAEESKVPFLRPALESVQRHVDAASKAFSLQDPSACAGPACRTNETRKYQCICWKNRSFPLLRKAIC